ncbi:MAG: hypothetical protein HGA39_04020 [Coriobacteriia bacterium]|nr:hypothetical protein [Coriobacteriia bacterium]
MTNQRACVVALVGAVCLAVMLSVLTGCGGTTGNPSDTSSSESTTTVVVPWSMKSNCATCHKTEGSSTTDLSCLVSKHTGATCTICHSDVTTLTTAHSGATASSTMPTRLTNTSVGSSVCLDCHKQADLAANTVNSKVLTDANGTVVNPHALPAKTEHVAIECTNCHQMHVSNANLATKAMAVCGSCHHENVFQCHICHS